MILIGQNNNDIARDSGKYNFSGIISYTNTELEGLSEPIDFGNGETCLKSQLRTGAKIVNLGLFITDWDEALEGEFDENIKSLKKWLSEYEDVTFWVRIGYEHTGKTDNETFCSVFNAYSSILRGDNVKTVLSLVGNQKDHMVIPRDENHNITFDAVGVSVFTANDSCSFAQVIQRECSVPMIISETCIASRELSLERYTKLLKSFCYHCDVLFISYISCDWDALDMWYGDGFFGEIDSRITDEIYSALASCFEFEKNINIGAGCVRQDNWRAVEKRDIDLTKESDFSGRFEVGAIDNIMCEHVLEHIEDYETALANCYKYLKKGGNLRVAVPDGSNPDKEYIKFVKPNKKNGHLHLFTVDTLTEALQKAGFKTTPVEYYEGDNLITTDYSDDLGKIKRSTKHGKGMLEGSSLIIDATK